MHIPINHTTRPLEFIFYKPLRGVLFVGGRCIVFVFSAVGTTCEIAHTGRTYGTQNAFGLLFSTNRTPLRGYSFVKKQSFFFNIQLYVSKHFFIFRNIQCCAYKNSNEYTRNQNQQFHFLPLHSHNTINQQSCPNQPQP